MKKNKDLSSQETKLIDKKKKLLDQIDKKRQEYYRDMRIESMHNHPVGAFITFRSMEGR